MAIPFLPRARPTRGLIDLYNAAVQQGGNISPQGRFTGGGIGTAQVPGAGIGSGSLPDALAAAGQINQANQAQVLSQYRAAIPNYNRLIQQSSQNIAGLLNPTDFRDVDELGAELGVSSGISGSGADASRRYQMRQADRERRMALGEQLFTGAAARRPQAPLADPSQFMITPYQRASINLGEFQALLNYLGRNRGTSGIRGGSTYAPSINGGPAAPAEATGGAGFTNPFTAASTGGGTGSFYAPPPTNFEDAYPYLFPDLHPPIVSQPTSSFTGDINYPVNDDYLYG